MQQIIIFGGAFDPPHLGHKHVVSQVLERQICEQIWLLPVGEHPFAKKMADDHHRLTMLELLFADLQTQFPSRITINTYEIDKQGVGYTYDTLQHFSNKFPDSQFSFLIGSDNIASFHKWRNYQQLLDQFKFLVYPRKNHPIHNLLPGMVPLQNFSEIEISSTQVKEALRQKREKDNLADLVGVPVADYIIKNGLYTN